MQNPRSARDYPLPHADNLLSEDQPRLAAAINAIDADITTLAGRATSVEAGVATLSASDATQASAIATLQGRATASEGDITSLNSKVSSTDGTLDTLQKVGDRVKTAETAIAGKAAASHTHSTGDITGLSAAITAGNVKLPGDVVQVVNFQSGALATGTAIIPCDDTIPQITEGTEFMTLAITPTSATNKLKIEVVVMLGNSAASQAFVAALFKDANADAIAMQTQFMATLGGFVNIHFVHFMTAGTTSPTTFRVRCGANNAGTTSFNGLGTRFYGGAAASSITITEIHA